MTFANYKNSNNASTKLIADISASATTLLITSGDEALFPSEYPFLLTIEHLDSDGNVIVREIVKATSGNQNSFIVERGAGTCVQDDTATTKVQSDASHSFYTGDSVSLYRTAEQVKDIQDTLFDLNENSPKQTSIADEYDDSATYEIGDVVMYKGERYVCNTDIATAEAFDSNKRTKTSVQTDFESVQAIAEEVAPVVSSLGALKVIDLIAVGGGGGGGSAGCMSSCGDYGGGGGGGGEVFAGLYLGTSTSYDVVIGCGGMSYIGKCLCTQACIYFGGEDGMDTHFGPLTVHGGKGGKMTLSSCNRACGGDSGAGYKGAGSWCSYGGGGGGGGAGGPGCCCTGSNCGSLGGNGGPGKCGFGGGGGGGGGYLKYGGAGTDGGGAGGDASCGAGCNGTNCGGGGGGGTVKFCSGSVLMPGGCGAGGIVIVKYPADGSGSICCATGGTITTETIDNVEYCVHTFTSNGTFCIVC